MAHLATESNQEIVVIRDTNGIVVIPRPSPLTRLHYFDGKFLRAQHLSLEQAYERRRVELSNQAGGAGVVHGLDCSLGGGDQLDVGPGMAVDSQGRVILLPQSHSLSITELIESSRQPPRSPHPDHGAAAAKDAFGECELREKPQLGRVLEGTELYVITVGHAEAYCGNEDVYGKLCEEACVTSTSRPYIIEGVAFRAEPLTQLETVLPTSTTLTLTLRHLRSQVASAYFRSRDRGINGAAAPTVLTTGVPCLGARLQGTGNVPVAIVARQGCTTLFLDAWIVRRERMEAPARTYWAGHMHMRPWHVFLAQILQFQCHLLALSRGNGESEPALDPCCKTRRQVVEKLEGLIEGYDELPEAMAKTLLPNLQDLQKIVNAVQAVDPNWFALADRRLVAGGIIDLPSAGYLPVDAKSPLTVNKQVRLLLGDGVNLRFCVVRPDYIPHALEQAQHMERISLTQGLDDPDDKPEVDILVPDGQIKTYQAPLRGQYYVGEPAIVMSEAHAPQTTARIVSGAGRAEVNAKRGVEFCFSGIGGLVPIGQGTSTRLAAMMGNRRMDATISSNGSSASYDRAGESSHVGTMPGPVAEWTWGDVGTPPKRNVAAWFHVAFSADPFVSPRPETMKLHLQCLWTWPKSGDDNLVLFGREIKGTLTRTGDQGSRVTGLFSGSETKIGPESTTWGDAVPISYDFTIERQTQNTWPVYTLRINDGNIVLALIIENAGTKLFGLARLPLGNGKSVMFGTRPRLQADNGVCEETDPRHENALTALDMLGARLSNEPNFVGEATQQLFPATDSNPQDLEVRATRDWVLFHRHRHIRCEMEPAEPAPPPAEPVETTCLSVYAGTYRAMKTLMSMVLGDKEPAEIRAALKRALGGNGITPMGNVTFHADSMVQENLAAVVEEWDTVQYAPHGAFVVSNLQQGRQTDFGRATEVYKALGGSDHLDALLTIDKAVDMPDEIACRAAIFVTRVPLPEVVHTGLSVYAVHNPGALENLPELVNSISTVGGVFTELEAQPLCAAVFKDETTNPVTRTEEVIKAWSDRFPGSVAGLTWVLSPAGSSSSASQTDLKRAQLVHSWLAGQGNVNALVLPAGKDLPGDVQQRAAMLIAAEPAGWSNVGLIIADPESGIVERGGRPIGLRVSDTGEVEADWAGAVGNSLDGREITEFVVVYPEAGPDPTIGERVATSGIAALRDIANVAGGASSSVRDLTAEEKRLVEGTLHPGERIILLRTRRRR